MAAVVSIFGTRGDREEARGRSLSDGEVSAPVHLSELTGWNRYSPIKFFRAALNQMAEEKRQKKKKAEKAAKSGERRGCGS